MLVVIVNINFAFEIFSKIIDLIVTVIVIVITINFKIMRFFIMIEVKTELWNSHSNCLCKY